MLALAALFEELLAGLSNNRESIPFSSFFGAACGAKAAISSKEIRSFWAGLLTVGLETGAGFEGFGLLGGLATLLTLAGLLVGVPLFKCCFLFRFLVLRTGTGDSEEEDSSDELSSSVEVLSFLAFLRLFFFFFCPYHFLSMYFWRINCSS